jgi:hypothetical protein
MHLHPAFFRFTAAAAFSVMILLAGCAGPGMSAPELPVTLSGAAAVPPNRSTAAGKARFWVRPDRTVSGVVETSGMDGTAACICLGRPGQFGPVVIQLVRTSSEGPLAMEGAPVSGASWSVPRSARLSEEQYRAFLTGGTYVNVHSARFPDGEIRAQLKP